MKESLELVFIPGPGMGHLLSAVEMAKLLLRHDHLSISVLIMKTQFDAKLSSYVESLLSADDAASSSRLKFLQLSEYLPAFKTEQTNKGNFLIAFIESHKPSVREIVNGIQIQPSSRLAGIIVDMFCVSMMDVADEFGVPTYVFYTSSAAMLGLHLHLQSLRDDGGVDVTEFSDSDPDLKVSTYSKPFPAKLLPAVVQDQSGGSEMFLDFAKGIRASKGILVNTFFELEPHALESLSKVEGKVPPVYPVGPVLNLQGDKGRESNKEIFEWLNNQPDSSVVFLCFGSGGSFLEPQVKEIALALEHSGHRFLWALRQPPSQGSLYPTDYNNPEAVLPEGFTERIKSTGKVIGWAPQAAVLAHPAVGGFVSHCGWNSTLESIWFGVPMATWPIYAEQQANAFELVRDIGVAVEIKMDYKKDLITYSAQELPDTVNAEVIETGIRKLMDKPGARIKAQELKQKSRKAVEESGASFNILQDFYEQVLNNMK